jgi:hypothetical protein
MQSARSRRSGGRRSAEAHAILDPMYPSLGIGEPAPAPPRRARRHSSPSALHREGSAPSSRRSRRTPFGSARVAPPRSCPSWVVPLPCTAIGPHCGRTCQGRGNPTAGVPRLRVGTKVPARVCYTPARHDRSCFRAARPQPWPPDLPAVGTPPPLARRGHLGVGLGWLLPTARLLTT